MTGVSSPTVSQEESGPTKDETTKYPLTNPESTDDFGFRERGLRRSECPTWFTLQDQFPSFKHNNKNG